MSDLIDRVGPLRLRRRRRTTFQALTRAIIHQQLSGQAADTILGRFKALFPTGSFPSPEDVVSTPPERMRSAGLSRAKAGFILELAKSALDSSLPSVSACSRMDDEEVVAQVTKVKGVGTWSAQMFLIFTLGRPDVLPIHDLGVQKGFQIAYRKRRLPTPAELERHGEKWRPYRSTAALYLWRATDFLKDGEW